MASAEAGGGLPALAGALVAMVGDDAGFREDRATANLAGLGDGGTGRLEGCGFAWGLGNQRGAFDIRAEFGALIRKLNLSGKVGVQGGVFGLPNVQGVGAVVQVAVGAGQVATFTAGIKQLCMYGFLEAFVIGAVQGVQGVLLGGLAGEADQGGGEDIVEVFVGAGGGHFVSPC